MCACHVPTTWFRLLPDVNVFVVILKHDKTLMSGGLCSADGRHKLLHTHACDACILLYI
jgi:hypothetical protein